MQYAKSFLEKTVSARNCLIWLEIKIRIDLVEDWSDHYEWKLHGWSKSYHWSGTAAGFDELQPGSDQRASLAGTVQRIIKI